MRSTYEQKSSSPPLGTRAWGPPHVFEHALPTLELTDVEERDASHTRPLHQCWNDASVRGRDNETDVQPPLPVKTKTKSEDR